ncbi:MAG TPA: chemotaxis protein CheC [Longimicrobiales bacterium]|nr:chemotaxis protein CheC [Longimicrobiales bacterium]
MIDIRELGTLQLDALREVANIGAGHAATALSQLTRQRIMLNVPQIRVVRLEEVAELTGVPDEAVAAVVMQVLGDLTGRAVQVFPGPTAQWIAEALLNRQGISFPDGFGEMEQSALKEAANILGAAYLSALSDFLGLLVLTSVPSLALDMAAAALTSGYLATGQLDEYVFCIETLFRVDELRNPLHAHFLLLPDSPSLEVILRSVRMA